MRGALHMPAVKKYAKLQHELQQEVPKSHSSQQYINLSWVEGLFIIIYCPRHFW